jgi:hypothetical protein
MPSIKRNMRLRSFVKISDLLLFIKELLQSQKKKAVHFTIDIYTILLSGQRFSADQKAMKDRMLAMLSRNQAAQNNNLEITYKMIIGKSSTPPNSMPQLTVSPPPAIIQMARVPSEN